MADISQDTSLTSNWPRQTILTRSTPSSRELKTKTPSGNSNEYGLTNSSPSLRVPTTETPPGLSDGNGLVEPSGSTGIRHPLAVSCLIEPSAQTASGSSASLGVESRDSQLPASSVSVGLTNGNGLTNGKGLTNGEGAPSGRNPGFRQPTSRRHLAAASVAVVALLVGTSLMLILNAKDDTARIRIDGEFGDWEGVNLANDEEGDSLPNVDLIDYGVISDGLYLSFYYRTVEPMFAGEAGRTARMLIDSDLDPATGFAFNGLGADYLIELYGKQGFVISSVFYTFESGRDAYDWNGFTALTTVSARIAGNEVETQVPLFDANLEASDSVAVTFQVTNELGYSDISDFPISDSQAPLMIRLFQNEVRTIALERTTTIGEMQLTAPMSEAVLEGLTMRLTSTATNECLESATLGEFTAMVTQADRLVFTNMGLTIVPGQSLSLPLSVSVAGNAPATSVLSLEVEGVTSDALASHSGSVNSIYIDRPTTDMVIDGAFVDWNWIEKLEDDPDDVSKPNLDITELAAVEESDLTYFYLEVAGDELLSGKTIPSHGARSKPGSKDGNHQSQPPVGSKPDIELPVQTGMDTIYIFLDANGEVPFGYKVQPGFYASHMVEIKGIDGVILEKKLKGYAGEDTREWKWETIANVGAANQGSRIELSINSPGPDLKALFHVAGWDQTRDESQVIEFDMPSSDEGRYQLI